MESQIQIDMDQNDVVSQLYYTQIHHALFMRVSNENEISIFKMH